MLLSITALRPSHWSHFREILVPTKPTNPQFQNNMKTRGLRHDGYEREQENKKLHCEGRGRCQFNKYTSYFEMRGVQKIGKGKEATTTLQHLTSLIRGTCTQNTLQTYLAEQLPTPTSPHTHSKPTCRNPPTVASTNEPATIIFPRSVCCTRATNISQNSSIRSAVLIDHGAAGMHE